MDNFNLREFLKFSSLQGNIVNSNINESKDSWSTKLTEIEKQGQIVTMEAKIEALAEMIKTKNTRLTMIDEDENLSELIDKKKQKEMQKEIKILEKEKAKMEKILEKMGGKKAEIIDGNEEITTESDDEEVDIDTIDEDHMPGSKVTYKGTSHTVVDDDGYIITLKNDETGKTINVNYNQFKNQEIK
jgi:hypothetical protein